MSLGESESPGAALSLSGQSPEENELGTLLLTALQDIFHDLEEDKIPSHRLVSELAKREEEPWGSWGKQGKPITQNQVAGLLKPFRIRSRDIWVGKSLRGYRLEDLKDAFSRYIPHSEVRDPRGSSSDASFSPLSEVRCEGNHRTQKNDLKPSPDTGSRTPRTLKQGEPDDSLLSQESDAEPDDAPGWEEGLL